MSPALGSTELLQISSTGLLSSHILILLEELWSNRKKRVSRFRRVPFAGVRFPAPSLLRLRCSIFNSTVVRPKHPVSLQGSG